ncbi:MAG TPA: MATE family efflux transporter [Paludibacter sp.]|nr:MATE family efflux transporter [Paludibacter sp.]
MNSTKNILKISYPIILTLVAQNVVNVTDTAFLGRVSEVALGASAIAGVYYFAIFMVGFGFSQGAQILIGRRNGEENYSQIGPIFNNSLLFNGFFALILFVASLVGMPHLMKVLVSSHQIYVATLEYLDWRIYGFFFVFLNVVFRSFYVGITDTRILTTSAFVTAITNIIFDYLLIFGKFGFPELGIAGAAIASVIAEAASLGYLIFHTSVFTDMKKYGLFSSLKVDFKTMGQILNLSIFIMFQFFISISTWFLFFIFIERMGERPLAVTNIGRSMYILLMIPASALATTAGTLVSNLIGAGQKDEVLKTTNKIIGITLLMVSPLIVFAFIFPELFAHIYTDDHSLMLASIPVIRVVSVAIAFFAVGCVIISAVSGTGSTKTAFYMEVVTLFFYITFVYYTAIINPQEVWVVWMSEFVYWTMIGGLGFWYLRKGNWRAKDI